MKMTDNLAGKTVCIAVMSAAAAVGRIAFAAVADIKPTTAIVILTGLAFGKSAGFLTGTLAALVSNFYFGQGLWTPWQMLAWGLIGLLAGFFSRVEYGKKMLVPTAIGGALAAYFFGFVMNIFYIAFYVRPLSAAAVFTALGASLVMDSVHAVSTAAFLLALTPPWLKKMKRIKSKYGIF